MERVALICLKLMLWLNIVFGEEDTLDNITFPIDLNSTDIKGYNTTAILRYGHQRTHECREFQKAYFCIMKCLEIGYDIAYANKACICTCYKDKVKNKYFTKPVDLKFPTTTKPAWYVGKDNNNTFNILKYKNIGGELVYYGSDEAHEQLMGNQTDSAANETESLEGNTTETAETDNNEYPESKGSEESDGAHSDTVTESPDSKSAGSEEGHKSDSNEANTDAGEGSHESTATADETTPEI